MKKYLLLLVLAVCSAPCFALPSRPVASVQERSEELPSDKEIAYVLSVLQQQYKMSQEFYDYREDLIETSGDHYIRVAFADEIGDFDRLAAEAKELLERYFTGGEYIGGISTIDEYVRITMIATQLNDMIYMLEYSFKVHIDMYQALFVPFKADYDESLNAFKECEAILRDYFYSSSGGGYLDPGFLSSYGAIGALNSTFETLFSDAEQAMCDMNIPELIDELNERLAEANVCVERLNNVGDVTYREQNAFNEAHDTLKSECYEVFVYYGYGKKLWSIDDEFKDAFKANGGIKEIIYNQEHTDIYISTVEKLIEDISNAVIMVKEAQMRYELCQSALDDAQKALDEAWATIKTECPDVYNNYESAFDGFGNELNGIGRGLSGAFQSQDAADSFMQSLSDLAKRAGETVDKAKNEQNGTTGVAGVEAAGNDAAEYYDLNGAKVTDPRPGTIVIKVDANGNTTKVVVR